MAEKELTKEEFYQQMYNEIHAALCCNHMTNATACFLASLAVRVSKLERNDPLRRALSKELNLSNGQANE